MFIVQKYCWLWLRFCVGFAAELDDDASGALAGGFGEAVCGLSVAGRELRGRLRPATKRGEGGNTLLFLPSY